MASVESIADIGVKLHVLKGKTDTAPIKDVGKELDILAQRQRTASFAAMNFNRIVQDSPYFLTSFNMGLMSIANNIAPFTESLAAAKKEGIGMLTMLKEMFTGIGGWLTVINLAVAGVQMLTMWMAQNKRETKDAAKEQDAYLTKLKEVAQFRNTGGVSFTRKQVETALYRATKERATLEGAIRLSETADIQYLLKMNELYEQTNGKRGRAVSLETKNLLLGVKTVSQYEERIKEIDKERAFLSENLETLKEQEKMVERLISLGGSASERAAGEKKVTEELGNQLELRKKLLIEQVKANQFSIFGENEAITEQDLKREAARMQAKRRKIGVLGAETALEMPKKPAEQGSEEGLDYGTAFTGAFSSTFTQGMTSAWTKIFGEANSIGEIFIQSFVGSLVSQLSGRLATSLLADVSGGGGIFGVLGGILGGIGSIFGLSSRGNEGRPVMAGASTNVVLNVDGKTFMKAVYEPNFKKSANNMIRTRRL